MSHRFATRDGGFTCAEPRRLAQTDGGFTVAVTRRPFRFGAALQADRRPFHHSRRPAGRRCRHPPRAHVSDARGRSRRPAAARAARCPMRVPRRIGPLNIRTRAARAGRVWPARARNRSGFARRPGGSGCVVSLAQTSLNCRSNTACPLAFEKDEASRSRFRDGEKLRARAFSGSQAAAQHPLRCQQAQRAPRAAEAPVKRTALGGFQRRMHLRRHRAAPQRARETPRPLRRHAQFLRRGPRSLWASAAGRRQHVWPSSPATGPLRAR